MPRTIAYSIPPEADGQTVEQFLRRRIGMSSRTVVRLKRVASGMMLDGVHVRTIDRVAVGQTLTVTMPEDAVKIDGMPLPLDIIYEDDDLIVIDKPPFLAVHPSAGKTDPTLANAVVAYFQQTGEAHSFRPLYRLDRNTSGLLLAAKSAHITYLLRERCDCRKTYYAIVLGEVSESGTVNAPIRIKEGCTITREVGDGGKESITHYEPIWTDGCYTLLRLTLETGRTHQIRVHMAYLGHPLVGDTMYGVDETLNRHALHCGELRFLHPICGENRMFIAPIAEDMRAFLLEKGWKGDE
ncbi:MAG: RluA family pseudouridine synthase [Clostridia bacterium]|nr:RluA family pseudouridine synthase [Clostridia bacterium]